MTLQAVIFDIGGVLVRTEDWSGRAKWEARLGLPERALATLVFDSDAAMQAALGAGPDRAIWEHVARTLKLDAEQLGQLRADFWSGDRLNTELLQFLRNLRPRWRTGILSNAWPEMRDMNVSMFGLDQVVDETIYSFEVGLLKPDPRIFEVAAQRLGVPAARVVFVDDFPQNVVAARTAGLSAVQFMDTPQTIAELRQLLG